MMLVFQIGLLCAQFLFLVLLSFEIWTFVVFWLCFKRKFESFCFLNRQEFIFQRYCWFFAFFLLWFFTILHLSRFFYCTRVLVLTRNSNILSATDLAPVYLLGQVWDLASAYSCVSSNSFSIFLQTLYILLFISGLKGFCCEHWAHFKHDIVLLECIFI